jgi:hypothetical protein
MPELCPICNSAFQSREFFFEHVLEHRISELYELQDSLRDRAQEIINEAIVNRKPEAKE